MTYLLKNDVVGTHKMLLGHIRLGGDTLDVVGIYVDCVALLCVLRGVYIVKLYNNLAVGVSATYYTAPSLFWVAEPPLDSFLIDS